MTALAGPDSGAAARILAAARDLVLKRGVKGLTIAEIAEKAHVGKGTAYLYWKTKEDLLLGLLTRDFLTIVDDDIGALTADPDIVRPHRLCPRVARNVLDRPLARALLTGDADLLGALARHPRSTELLDQIGPAALMNTALPIWREYRLARADWPLSAQAHTLQALMTGFLHTATRTPTHRPTLPSTTDDTLDTDNLDTVIAAAVTALLGPENAGPTDVRAAASHGLQSLHERRAAVLAMIPTKTEAMS